jgi:hypothetical protein
VVYRSPLAHDESTGGGTIREVGLQAEISGGGRIAALRLSDVCERACPAACSASGAGCLSCDWGLGSACLDCRSLIATCPYRACQRLRLLPI